MPRRARGASQQMVYDYIVQHYQEKNYPPSIREICDHVNLSSSATVYGHLVRLEKKGLIRRNSGKTRAIELVNGPVNPSNYVRQVPVVGRVAAGVPILAEESLEDTIYLPVEMVGDCESYILKVVGDSMIECGIMDGDYVVVQRQVEPRNGDIVVAMIDNEATVKRFFREKNRIRLQPENSTMEPIYARNPVILGKVISSYRLISKV